MTLFLVAFTFGILMRYWLDDKRRALPFPHLSGRGRLAADQDYDSHLTDNPNNAAPRESCWGDARQRQYTT